MKCKLKEEQLVMFYYDEVSPSEKEFIRKHIAECQTCMKRYTALKKTLDGICFDEQGLSFAEWVALKRKVLDRVSPERRAFLWRPVVGFIVLVLLVIGGYIGFRTYQKTQEQRFISQNYELLINLDFYQDLEVLEKIEEIDRA
ncbi:MAG: hypothetical protein D6778_01440 [Nitrospirae bacterium]|nr:MAG: hypothetical protein D6778_01440 [Nitrospirota bacterium]